MKIKLVENLDDIELNDDRPYGLEPEYKFVKEKDIVDSEGFSSVYSWYMNDSGESKFFYDDVEDWECETPEEANEWFDNFTGSYDIELVTEAKETAMSQSLEETVDMRPNETKFLEIIEDDHLNTDKLCRQLIAWLSDEDVGRFMTAYNYDVLEDDSQVIPKDTNDVVLKDIDDVDLGDLNEPSEAPEDESKIMLDDDMTLTDAEVESLKRISSDNSKLLDESAEKSAGSVLDELKNVKFVEVTESSIDKSVNDVNADCTMSAGSYDDEF